MQALRDISRDLEFIPLRQDHSEPGAGKDRIDGEMAMGKTRVANYLNMGNDVVNGEQLVDG